MGFSKFTDKLWHSYIQVGTDADTAWTIGWAGGEPYPEDLNDNLERHINLNLKRSKEGMLPNGTPCKQATPKELQDCVMDDTVYPKGVDYNVISANCGDWVEYVVEKCEPCFLEVPFDGLVAQVL